MSNTTNTTARPIFVVTSWLGVFCGTCVLSVHDTRDAAWRSAGSSGTIHPFASLEDAIAEFPEVEKMKI